MRNRYPISHISLFMFGSRFSVRSVMHKYLEKKNEVNFDKIFNQMLGELCWIFNICTPLYLLSIHVHTHWKKPQISESPQLSKLKNQLNFPCWSGLWSLPNTGGKSNFIYFSTYFLLFFEFEYLRFYRLASVWKESIVITSNFTYIFWQVKFIFVTDGKKETFLCFN